MKRTGCSLAGVLTMKIVLRCGAAAGLAVAAPMVAGAAPAGAPAPVVTDQAGAMPMTAAPAPLGAAAIPKDYRLGPNDRVTISVYGEDDLSREYIVAPAGTISLPLIGDITANGRTADDLRAEITRRLADGFINNPTVTVQISAFRNFYILGEVNKPGEYPFETGLTVTQAVAEAAGYTYRAARRTVYIRHEGQTVETKVPVTPGMSVEPGDTIRFGERYF